MPNVLYCRAGDPAVTIPAPRRIDPAALTWAVSLGLPSPEPEAWRADVRRARQRLAPSQLLVVSVAGTPAPDGDPARLAQDYARCAAWAVEAGADVLEVHLACPDLGGEQPRMPFEDRDLSARILERVRRAVGAHPVIAKLGAAESPRALHDLASRLAPWVEGFVLVNGLQRRVVREDGSAAFPGPGRHLAGVFGGEVFEHCRMQVEELLAWRKAGAWSHAILAVGGITTVGRARTLLEAGADAALLATGALADPLLACRYRLGQP